MKNNFKNRITKKLCFQKLIKCPNSKKRTKFVILRNKVSSFLRLKKQYLGEELKDLLLFNSKRLFYKKISSTSEKSKDDTILFENKHGNAYEIDHDAADCLNKCFFSIEKNINSSVETIKIIKG